MTAPRAREAAFSPVDRGAGALRRDASGAPASGRGGLRFAWIISRPHDLGLLLGGTLAGYALLGAYVGLGWDMVAVWFVWFMTLDSPHFFATYARTFLDKDERRARRPLLRRSLLCFLVGPAVLLLCLALYALHVAAHAAPFLALTAFVNLWAYWHVVRQHYGLLALYKRKASDLDPVDARIDAALLYVGLLAPLVAFVVNNHEARAILGLAAQPSVLETAAAITALSAVLLAALVYAGRQVLLWRAGRPVNATKALFFAAVVPLHVAACALPAVSRVPILGFAAFVTIHHDIQYLTLVRFTLKNRRGEDRGVAARFGKSLPLYLGAAVATGVTLGALSCKLGVLPGCLPLLATAHLPLFGALKVRDLLFTVFLGFLMQHYVVDQYIWRVSRDPGLRRDLRVAPE